MHSIKEVLEISFRNIKKWVINPRIYIILAIVFLYMQSILFPIREFCDNVGVNITPYVLPFFMTEPYSAIIICLLVVLIFCDAPFVDQEHSYVILRAGRKKWFAGQILYMLLASMIYTMVLVLLSNLILVPYVGLDTSWGKVINTLAQRGIGFQHGISIPFDNTILQDFSGIKAMVLQGSLCFLLFFFLGNIIFLFNSCISRRAGGIGAVVVILFPRIAADIAPKISYISPVSWISLSNLDVNRINHYPTPMYAFLILIIGSLLMIVLSFLVLRKRDVEVQRSI